MMTWLDELIAARDAAREAESAFADAASMTICAARKRAADRLLESLLLDHADALIDMAQRCEAAEAENASLRSQIDDRDNDSGVCPEDFSVTETVNALRKRIAELEAENARLLKIIDNLQAEVTRLGKIEAIQERLLAEPFIAMHVDPDDTGTERPHQLIPRDHIDEMKRRDAALKLAAEHYMDDDADPDAWDEAYHQYVTYLISIAPDLVEIADLFLAEEAGP